MRFLKFTHAGAALMLGLLSACTVVVDEPGPPPPGRPRPPGPPICTREYDPVCARRGPDRRTFGNGCLAEAAGYRILGDGECGFGPPPGSPPGPPPEDRFCTREYQPVCGQKGSRTRTFGNECEAEAADYRVIDDGPC